MCAFDHYKGGGAEVRIGKILAAIAGFLVCVSFIRAVNGAGGIGLYDILLTVQQFEYDTTTISDIAEGIEALPDIPGVFDEEYWTTSVLEHFFLSFQHLFQLVRAVIVPIFDLVRDTLTLLGDLIHLVFSMLGFVDF